MQKPNEKAFVFSGSARRASGGWMVVMAAYRQNPLSLPSAHNAPFPFQGVEGAGRREGEDA